jgi:hypothetical protein
MASWKRGRWMWCVSKRSRGWERMMRLRLRWGRWGGWWRWRMVAMAVVVRSVLGVWVREDWDELL